MPRKSKTGASVAETSTVVHQYPRVQLTRPHWTSLNGPWEFAIDAAARWTSPREVTFDRTIGVPFAPETPASGVNETGFFDAVWYRRAFDAPPLDDGRRLILHFGAVDYEARVWVNGALAGTHVGGYTPFSFDVTDLLDGARPRQTIVVRALDDPHDLAKPRGKQDWRREPHSIWYYRTSGIWQTVWTEVVPRTRVESLRWTPSVQDWAIDLAAEIAGPVEDGMRLRVRLRTEAAMLADDVYSVRDREVLRRIALPDAGIDDARNDLLWWPWRPTLIFADVELLDAEGRTIDAVGSYTAMRSVAVEGSRFVFNGRPMDLRLVLDQGYWPQSGLTGPDDDALRRDVELVKALGFNGVRKHQKIEDPRFLYWADVLGLLVWEEMPSPYRFSGKSVERLTAEWLAALRRDVSHPCIVAWVPFNESWGVPDLPNVAAQREFVRGVFHLTKAFDPTRPVIGNDGWEMVVTDVVAIHDYERVPAKLAQRYARSAESLADLFAHERPGHRQLLLDGCAYAGQPIMLTEFGGIAYSRDTKGTWGYKRAGTAAEFERQYAELMAAVRALPLFAGFCYTQFTDTYQEANGLLYMDRTAKVAVERVREVTGGGGER